MIHITKHETGKLKGIPSINTSVIENDFCEAMARKSGLVCVKCYARRLTKLRKSLERHLVENSWLLKLPLRDDELPRFNEEYVRFHSFGELQNLQHLQNFYRIAEANPFTEFALWTKRVDLVEQAGRAPNNLALVYSVPELDPKEVKVPVGFDTAYAVYTTGEPCGPECIYCLKCWNHGTGQIIKQLIH